MDAQTSTQTRENARLGDIANRSEKGTALSLIRAETKARDAKTARLKALRLAQEADTARTEAELAELAPRSAKSVRSKVTKSAVPKTGAAKTPRRAKAASAA